MKEIDKLRQEINDVSQLIANLLLKRKALSHQIRLRKQDLGLSRRDPQREQELIELLTQNMEEEDRRHIQNVFAAILSDMHECP